VKNGKEQVMKREEKAALEKLRITFEDRLNLHNDIRGVLTDAVYEKNPRPIVVQKVIDEWEGNWHGMEPTVKRTILRVAALKIFSEAIEIMRNRLTEESPPSFEEYDDD